MGNSYGSDPAIQAGAVLNIAVAERCAIRKPLPPLADEMRASRSCGAPARYVVTATAGSFAPIPACDALDLEAAVQSAIAVTGGASVAPVPSARYWRCRLADWSDQQRGAQGTGLCGGGTSDVLTDATIRVRQPDAGAAGGGHWGAYCFAHIATGVMVEGEGSDGIIGDIEWLMSCAGCFRPAAWAGDDREPLDDRSLCGICRYTLEWGPNGWMPKAPAAAAVTS